MTISNNKINYKGAFANFEELICKLLGTYINCFKDLLAIKHKMRIVVQIVNNIHIITAKQIPRMPDQNLVKSYKQNDSAKNIINGNLIITNSPSSLQILIPLIRK